MPVPHEITSDRNNCWINGEGGLLGRFGINGIDVHQPMTLQSERGECLFCTHTKTTLDDWKTFVAKMKEHFDIDVPIEHLPGRLFKDAVARGGNITV